MDESTKQEPPPTEGQSTIRLKPEDVQFFNRQLASMARLNMPISKGLRILARDVSDPEFKLLIETVQQDLDEGMSLTEAMARHPATFSTLHLEIVKAGESTGNLSVILDELNAHSEAMQRVKSRVLEAVIYPAVISSAMFVFVIFFLRSVAPNFRSMVEAKGAGMGTAEQLPGITRFLFSLSDLAQSTPLLVVTVVGAVVLAGIGFRKLARMGESYDEFMFNLPVFGRLFEQAALMKVTRTMRDLLTHGVSMVETLRLTANTVGTNRIQTKLDELRSAVEEGGSFSRNLSGDEVFPDTMVWKLQLAEEKGIIEAALGELAAEFDVAVDRRTTLITKLMAPTLLLAMGGVVFIMFLACILPLTQFGTSAMQ
jgi:type II secretory pathway component PulF